MATAAEVRELLAATSVPAGRCDELVEAATQWLMGGAAEVVAADLVLCHPPLAPGEIRAAVRATVDPESFRLTVVAEDRPGLLARMAGCLWGEAITVTSASVLTIADEAGGLAVQRITARPADTSVEPDWDGLGSRLQAALREDARPDSPWRPAGPVEVDAHPGGASQFLTLSAPDQPGLLWAISSWLTDAGCSIDAFRASVVGDRAVGSFLVTGTASWAELAEYLGGQPARSALPSFPLAPLRLAGRVAAVGLSAGLVGYRTLRRAGGRAG